MTSFESILASLHRDDFTHDFTHEGIVDSPPREGRLEDNSILYKSLLDPLVRSISYDPLSLRHSTLVPEGPKSSSAVALERIETLSLEQQRLIGENKQLRAELDGYRKSIGSSLDEFHANQVQLREEVCRLRELTRQAQEEEAAAKGRTRQVEAALRRLESGFSSTAAAHGVAEAPEERLAQLQNALAKAYLQRTNLLSEIAAAKELQKSMQWREEILSSLREEQQSAHAPSTTGLSPSSDSRTFGSLSHWRARGKEAELLSQLQHKEQLIRSLSKAEQELIAMMETESFKKKQMQGQRDDVVSKCPGCGRGQWTSPYCPETGHTHAGYQAAPHRSTTATSYGSSDPPGAVRAPTVEDALKSGKWLKMVDVDNAVVCYEEVGTRRQVVDLEAELKRRFDEEQKAAAPPVLPKDAVVLASPMMQGQKREEAKLGFDNEMRRVLAALRDRDQEVERLKQLLKRALDDGALEPKAPVPPAAPSPPPPVAATKPPLADLPMSPAQSVEERLEQLQATNQQLNQRCTELLCEISARDSLLDERRNEIDRLRFGGPPFGAGEVHKQLETELEKAHRDLMLERRRVVELHEEIKRLRSAQASLV